MSAHFGWGNDGLERDAQADLCVPTTVYIVDVGGVIVEREVADLISIGICCGFVHGQFVDVIYRRVARSPLLVEQIGHVQYVEYEFNLAATLFEIEEIL